jgi:integrase
MNCNPNCNPEGLLINLGAASKLDNSTAEARRTDFVMILTIAYTGMRWSEAIGLPQAV